MTAKRPSAKYKIAMLIDDNEIDNFINQKMIEGTNFSEKTFVFTSGKGSLEYFNNIGKDTRLAMELMPDILFLDINMPMMDGFQFLDQFNRINEKLENKCKIAILTTSINPEDKNRFLLNKMVVSYLNKPLTEKALGAL